MPEKADPAIGRLALGRYRIVRQLARGGMGVVYLARMQGAAGFVKPAVVKRILPGLTEEDNLVRMFVREARILSNLQHPGIVAVLDFGQEDDAYVMVLEYVHGFHLAQWQRYASAKEGAFPVDVGIQIAIQVLDALHYAHTLVRADGKSVAIVHRDVSPSNVLIDTSGRVKLADFGIARATGDTSEYKTEEFALRGKLAFTSPELLKGDAPSARSDLYACGVLLHELLVGENEFRGDEVSDTVNRVLQHEASRVELTKPSAPSGLDDVLARALAKNAEDRFATAAEFAQALRDMRSLPEDAANATVAEQASRDFTDDMADFLGVARLQVLDAAWREDAGMRADAETSSMPSSPRKDHSHPRTRRATRTARGTPAIVAAAIAGVAILAAVVLALVGRHPEPAPRPVIVVSGDERPAAPSTGGTGDQGASTFPDPTVPVDAGSAAPDASTAERPVRSATKVPLAVDLTRQFRANEAAIGRCLDENTDALDAVPRVVLRITVQPTGSVGAASFVTGRLDGTPLGDCLLRVARDARFRPLERATTFQIPFHFGPG